MINKFKEALKKTGTHKSEILFGLGLAAIGAVAGSVITHRVDVAKFDAYLHKDTNLFAEFTSKEMCEAYKELMHSSNVVRGGKLVMYIPATDGAVKKMTDIVTEAVERVPNADAYNLLIEGIENK